jgi:outer membrane receptor protein involved in Fe transport
LKEIEMANSMRNKKTSIETRALSAMMGLIVVLMIVPLSLLRAQEAGGTIVGTVMDPSGAAVASANVSIKNIATGVERSVPTNDDGLYVAPNLVPGSYEIQVTATGFSSTLVSEVVLTVGERREINVTLKIGQASDKVTVEGSQISDIQLASSAVGNVVDSRTVVDLPLNGRDWTSLAQLEPGVAQVRTQKSLAINNDRANRGLGVDITIGGNRPQQNNYRLDGVSINDQTSGAPGSIQGAVLGVDAVQEFSVVTSNAPADYGKTSGGVINAASRSGTNSFHGTAYEFLRNSVFDARNFFDNSNPAKGPTIPSFKRNQFGASAAGPVIKDHTFFFADYEGLRQGLGVTSLISTPSDNARNGQLANGSMITVSPLVKPYLALYPRANCPNGVDACTFIFVANTITNEDFVTTRIDHKLGASDTLFGTYLFDKGSTASPDTFDLKNIGTQSRRHTVALEESHIFTSALLNTARFGFNRTVSVAPTTLGAINPAAADTSLGFVTDATGKPILPVGLINVTGLGTNFPGGIGALGEFDFHYNSFQVYDDLYWTRSKHSLKLGFNVERIQSNQFSRGANPNGQFIFNSVSDFLTDNPASFNAARPSTRTPRDLRQTLFGLYVQDDFKFRSNLTLNLGLRYEMATVPTETANQLTTLVNLTDTAPKIGSPYFSNPTLRNFEPRVGFAWDPFRTGKTSVRGAFGIYDVLPLPYQFELLSLLSAPFALAGGISYDTVNKTGQDRFPTGSFLQTTLPGALRFGYVEPTPHRNYVEQWTLNVQRELFRNFTLTVGYIGSHGVHSPFHADEVNFVQPTLTSAGYAWPVNKTGTRLNPTAGQISAVMWSTSSTYHGLNLEAIKRLSHGFQIQASYTFSKSIDTSSSGIAGDTFGNSVSSPPAFDPRLRRGLSDFDVRNILAINALWMIPNPQSWSSVPKWAASGWQVGGIFMYAGGLPFTPLIGGDPLGLKAASTESFAFPNTVAGCNPVNGNFKSTANGPHYINAACFTFPATDLPSNTTLPRLLGNSGRNTVIGPDLKDLDFSLFKNNAIHRISETFNVQFRWEIFNIANHANFGPPPPGNRQIFSLAGAVNANAGLLNATSTTSRQMQFALKFIW